MTDFQFYAMLVVIAMTFDHGMFRIARAIERRSK